MSPELIRAADAALLVCGARASALLYPNREHPPTPEDRAVLAAEFRRDLVALRDQIDGWLRSDHDVHARTDGGGR